MAPAPDSFLALIQEIEAGIDSLCTDPLLHGHPRALHDLHLLARIEEHLHANPPSPADVTGELAPIAPRRSNADRHTDDSRSNWFEPLNDTTLSPTRPGRTKRKYRKTPPPPINRHQSTSQIAATPHQDDSCGSARLNRFEEPLNDTTGRTKRVYRKTPPPPINRSEIGAAAPFQDDICGSARFDIFEPLDDATSRPK